MIAKEIEKLLETNPRGFLALLESGKRVLVTRVIPQGKDENKIPLPPKIQIFEDRVEKQVDAGVLTRI